MRLQHKKLHEDNGYPSWLDRDQEYAHMAAHMLLGLVALTLASLQIAEVSCQSLIARRCLSAGQYHAFQFS